MTLGEMEHVYSGCAAVMVYAGKNRVFVEVQEMAAAIGWQKHNMVRSVRAFLRLRSEYHIKANKSNWPVLELPTWQRFFHWLLFEALAGKPLTQRGRYASLMKVGALIGLAGFEKAYMTQPVRQAYAGRGEETGWEAPAPTKIEGIIHSLHAMSMQGRTLLVRLAEALRVPVHKLKSELVTLRSKDSRIPAPDQDGSVGAFETAALLVGANSNPDARLMTVAGLIEYRAVRTSSLPPRCSGLTLTSPQDVESAMWRMDGEMQELERKLHEMESAQRATLDQVTADLITFRSRCVGLEAELNAMKAGIANATQSGLYSGGEGVIATEHMRRRGFLTSSDVVEIVFHKFADPEGKPFNPALLGNYTEGRANVTRQLRRLLRHMVLCKALKAGKRPHVKPSMNGLVVVQNVKVSDLSSGGHLLKHSAEKRSRPQVFYGPFIVNWFVVNGPSAIDDWASAGYPQPA